MDFSKYIFRASEVGKLFGASGKLTDTNKTYLKELFTSAINGTRKQIQSKYFEKGLFEEQTGIDLLNKIITTFIDSEKNVERKNNGFITGEMDTEKQDIIYEVKNAWDIYTFDKSSLTHEYKWQVKSYLWLWEAQHGRLFYCLNNTPDHILESEARKLLYAGNYVSDVSPSYVKDCQELRKQHTHDFKPLEERFKIWDVYLDSSDIQQIQLAVITARLYLQELWENREAHLKANRLLMQDSNYIATPID